MRIYVAGASLEWKRCRRTMIALRGLGHHITHDWTIEVEKHINTPAEPHELSEYAWLDKRGVELADELVLLVPNGSQTTGAWAELGMAIEMGTRVRASGPRAACVFLHLPCCETYDSDEELLAALSVTREK